MVSLSLILYNMFQLRRFPTCVVKKGKHSDAIPYIAHAERSDKVIIGNFCSFARGVILIAHPGHYPPKEYQDYRVSTYAISRLNKEGFLPHWWLPEKRNFVNIGNDVFLGANSIVLPGVTIGNGVIIGAGSVVSKDIPDYAIAAGDPARILRYRYSEDQINKLLRIAWWNWDDKKIQENINYFYGKVDVFIEKFFKEIEQKSEITSLGDNQ